MAFQSYPNRGTVLLVDNEPTVRKLVSDFLEEQGYYVDVLYNGAEAFELWREKQHNVIICEAELEGIDGFTLLKMVLQENDATQVVIISEPSDMHDVVQALRLGAADYVLKPIDMVVLEHAIKRGVVESRLISENTLYQEALEAKNKELKESLRLLKEDQEAGRAVQLKMLPPTHIDIGRLSIDYEIIPSLYLSGDFIDYFKISEHQVGFYLADVSGHGASSAFVTILLKTMANRLRRRYEDPTQRLIGPSEILQIANEELIPLGLGKHLAVFSATIDTQTKVITYCSAAHFPPPLLLSEKGVVPLIGKGLPVGLFEGASFDEHQVELGDRFKLVAFSDGILETMEQDSVAEKEQFLLEMVSKGTHNVGAIMKTLGITAEDGVPDDIAIMTVSLEWD